MAVAATRAAVLAYSLAVWATTSIDDAGAIKRAQRLVPVVASAQLRVANLTAAYLAKQTGTEPARISDEALTQSRGVDPALVYQRPVITTRSELKQAVRKGEPVDLDTARQVGARRLESLVTTDLQLAKVRQAGASLIAADRQYYRRVPRSEGACALCLIASTQRYKIHALMPIHPGCQCGVDVLPDGMDLDDNVIDVDLLEATHARVKEFTGIADRGGRAPDYRKLLITRHHGELGGVLAYRGYEFTGKSDLPKTRKLTVALGGRPNAEVTYNRDPSKGAVVPEFLGGTAKRTPEQRAAMNNKLARLLADLPVDLDN